MEMILMFLCVLVETVAGEFRVICLTRPIEAGEGDNVTPWCCSDPPVNMVNFTLNWKRLGLDKDVVRAYRHRQDHLYDQVDRYRVNRNQNKTRRETLSTTRPPVEEVTKPADRDGENWKSGLVVIIPAVFIIVFALALALKRRTIQDRLRRLRGRTDAQTADEDEVQETV